MKLCNRTGKRCYSSEQQAKAKCRHMRERIRVYRCDHCHALHVANAEKR